jgi:hypothetical protein
VSESERERDRNVRNKNRFRNNNRSKSIQEKTQKKKKERRIKSQRHPEFPSGLPSKYYPGPMLLNFSDRTRTGVFNMVWPLTKKKVFF